MYLRPSALNKTFAIETRSTGTDTRGRTTAAWVAAGNLVGVLSEARPDEKMRWQQLQHPVTHTVVQKGAPQASVGDRLVLDSRNFYIQGVENPGGLDHWTIYYCEERQDK